MRIVNMTTLLVICFILTSARVGSAQELKCLGGGRRERACIHGQAARMIEVHKYACITAIGAWIERTRQAMENVSGPGRRHRDGHGDLQMPTSLVGEAALPSSGTKMPTLKADGGWCEI
jgi:hypothetical protein